MKKTILPLLISALLLPTVLCACSAKDDPKGNDYSAYTPIGDDDFLQTQGQFLVNGRGERVTLRGTNLGGWLHLEGWMDGGGGVKENVWGNHAAVLDALAERFTDEQIQSLLEVYQNAYIRESDFFYIASLGLNVVRIPFFWTEILDKDGNVHERAFDQLDFAINTCKKLGIYVILDLHGAVGGHSGGWTTGGIYDSNRLWYDGECQARTVKIWQAIAARYKDEPTVAGYDLLNEPVTPDESDLAEDIPPDADVLTKKEVYDLLYRTVRAIDPKRVCLMGAFFSFDALGDPEENGWENVIYQTHHYDDANKSEENQLAFAAGQLAYIREYAEKWDVPVLAGEFSFWSAREAWRSWLSVLDATGVSWCNWTYKNTAQDETLRWGLYDRPDVEYVDYEKDSYAEIARKWRNFSTDRYTENAFLAEIFAEATKKREKIDLSRAVVRASSQEATAARLFDGKYFGDDARWTSGVAQDKNAGQYLEIEFANPVTFSRVDIFTPCYDYSADYVLSALCDGERKTLYAGAGFIGNQILTFEEVTATALRLEQRASSPCWWSVYELTLFR